MTIKEIIDGLKFTVEMFLLDPSTGERYAEPRNDMDKTTIDACKGAIELLEHTSWIPVSDRMPEDFQIILFSTNTDGVFEGRYFADNTDCQWYAFRDETFVCNNVVTAWMPLPKSYKSESGNK